MSRPLQNPASAPDYSLVQPVKRQKLADVLTLDQEKAVLSVLWFLASPKSPLGYAYPNQLEEYPSGFDLGVTKEAHRQLFQIPPFSETEGREMLKRPTGNLASVIHLTKRILTYQKEKDPGGVAMDHLEMMTPVVMEEFFAWRDRDLSNITKRNQTILAQIIFSAATAAKNTNLQYVKSVVDEYKAKV